MLPPISEADFVHRRDIVLAFLMGSHPRLGQQSPVHTLSDSDVLREILTALPIIVGGPQGTVSTLKEALGMALGDGQIIRISEGEHIVGSNPGQTEESSGLTVLEINRPVRLVGEHSGKSVLRGMLVLGEGAHTGRISYLTIHDAGQKACVTARAGCWSIDHCDLLSGCCLLYPPLVTWPRTQFSFLFPQLMQCGRWRQARSGVACGGRRVCCSAAMPVRGRGRDRVSGRARIRTTTAVDRHGGLRAGVRPEETLLLRALCAGHCERHAAQL